ncbi:unnamed protein product [Litomosoides sigmodontis]|uniref:Uncharacterized protein n=1 Tax=Litomosoides sigmodontis TaxID=42156 RepID=A0A3P6TUY3_LITSI|nr:unnamed protein product [Litomosoides sigmodontis]
MRPGPADKLSYAPCNIQSKKSASVETWANQDSTKNSSKFVPSRQISGSSALRIVKSHTFLNDKLSNVEACKQNIFLNQDKYSKLVRPKNLPRRPENDIKTSSIVKAFKVHLEPKTAQFASPPDRILHVTSYSPTISFTMTDEMHTSKEEYIKGAEMKPIFVEDNAEHNSYRMPGVKFQNTGSDHEQAKARRTGRQRSFIPLCTTSSRRLPARKLGAEAGQAPLAECESSCIENSPAVEVPPVKFIQDINHRHVCIENSAGEEATESQSLGPGSSTNSAREGCSNQLLSSEKTTVKKSFDDEKNACTTISNVALPDSTINNNDSPNLPTNCSCDNDTKLENSPNDFTSPTAMTSSGFTTSGFQDSPDKSPDKDAELSEQFLDRTFIQNYVFRRMIRIL